jgi:hypothetical protein
MKPIVNYGLSDSLIDAVRKTVEEAKLHPNQQKLDVHEPEKDELTSQDFKKLRAGKKVKDGIDTKPKLKEEEQMDEAPMKSGAQSRREVDSFMDQYGLGSKQKEAPKSNIRKVVGKSYGADYKDPEGEDETAADMKKPEPKRKSGPQGTMKRRFNTKSYDKIKGKLKAQY